YYGYQWGLDKIEAPWAWTHTTGNHRIIVAVLDTGLNLTHPDLAANVWTNPGETGLDANGNEKATNGIDDDGNGYIDDVNGWEFEFRRPHVSGGLSRSPGRVGDRRVGPALGRQPHRGIELRPAHLLLRARAPDPFDLRVFRVLHGERDLRSRPLRRRARGA